MYLKSVLQFLLWITLSFVALFGGATEKWWLVLTILLCFMLWVLYLLVKLEKAETVLKATGEKNGHKESKEKKPGQRHRTDGLISFIP